MKYNTKWQQKILFLDILLRNVGLLFTLQNTFLFMNTFQHITFLKFILLHFVTF